MKKVLSLIFLSIFNAPALADYKPPVERRRQRTESHIVRGCENNSAKITIVAPTDEIGSTASSNPTFLVDISQLPPTPLIVSIIQPKIVEPFYYREIVPKKAGRLAIVTNGNLKTGEYILNVGYFCQRNPDRDPIYARIYFKKADLSSQRKLQLEQSASPQQLLFDWGLYFDAVAFEYEIFPSSLIDILPPPS
jgi:hypothetical protein